MNSSSLSDFDKPLAERMRPRCLDDFIGQSHIVGSDSGLREALSEWANSLDGPVGPARYW